MSGKTCAYAGIMLGLFVVLTLGLTFPALAAPPPHMGNALRKLYEAKAELQQTVPHAFGGHRARALRAVDQAIAEVQEAIRFVEHGGGGGRWDDPMQDIYRAGYKDGRHDFKTGQGNQYRRHFQKYDRRFEPQYRQGYEDGYSGRMKQY